MRGYGCINLKGKKSLRLRCGCCESFNEKEEYFEKLAKKDMKNYENQY